MSVVRRCANESFLHGGEHKARLQEKVSELLQVMEQEEQREAA
ncbi:hypothetical protein [Paenibacillus uliginis]|nr:hypothetical protein [Paenibacillus uliginis]